MFHEHSDLNFKVHSNCAPYPALNNLLIYWRLQGRGKQSHLLTKQKIIELYIYQLGEIWVQNLAKTKPKGKWK